MSVTSSRRQGGGYLERPAPSGLADVVEVILDKGIVIDAYVRVSLVGIELLTIDARIVIASVDTYLRFAEACGFELSNYERHQTHIYSLQDLLVSSEFYARTHPAAWASAEEVTERGKVAKKKEQRLQKALAGASAKPAKAAPAAKPVAVEQS